MRTNRRYLELGTFLRRLISQRVLRVYFSQKYMAYIDFLIFTGGAVAKNLPANAGVVGEVGSTSGSGRSSGGGNDNPLHYSSLENSMDRGA